MNHFPIIIAQLFGMISVLCLAKTRVEVLKVEKEPHIMQD
jgi:hypothetical protein